MRTPHCIFDWERRRDFLYYIRPKWVFVFRTIFKQHVYYMDRTLRAVYLRQIKGNSKEAERQNERRWWESARRTNSTTVSVKLNEWKTENELNTIAIGRAQTVAATACRGTSGGGKSSVASARALSLSLYSSSLGIFVLFALRFDRFACKDCAFSCGMCLCVVCVCNFALRNFLKQSLSICSLTWCVAVLPKYIYIVNRISR